MSPSAVLSSVPGTKATVSALLGLPAWWGRQRCKQTPSPIKAEVWTRSCESTEDGAMSSGPGEMGVAKGSGTLPGVGDTGSGSIGMNFD